MKVKSNISAELLEDLISIKTGLYSPVDSFMCSSDYYSVVKNMQLQDGSVWTLPVTLDVAENVFKDVALGNKLYLEFDEKEIAFIEVSDCYIVDPGYDSKYVFGTTDLNHPGVKKEHERSPYRVGGKITILDESILDGALNPVRTKRIFNENNWNTVLGFQTRNPIHRGHEYLQRKGLSICDGLFINPSVGWKKEGDFTEEVVLAAYEKMKKDFYPAGKVYIEGLKVFFRYAGPREAVFHALLRRNLGCTHFIIGRDHAGVGGYYAPYAAHELAKSLMRKQNLGIELIFAKEIYYCIECNCIVEENECNHNDSFLQISGTNIRRSLVEGIVPDERFMRPEISNELLDLENDMFIGGEDEKDYCDCRTSIV